MDTSSFDKQAKQHLKVYENVMFAAKICIVAIIATLVIMAATLVYNRRQKTAKSGIIPPFYHDVHLFTAMTRGSCVMM